MRKTAVIPIKITNTYWMNRGSRYRLTNLIFFSSGSSLHA
jgi:hypothetical protein